MKFQAGTQISFSISVEEVMRPGLTILSATYQIFDETETAFAPAAAVVAVHSAVGAHTVDVNANAIANSMMTSNFAEGRTIAVTVNLSDNSRGVVTFGYVIQKPGSGLVRWTNTVVTMSVATRIASELGLDSWLDYSTSKKVAALKIGYDNLLKLRFQPCWDITCMTAAQIEKLDAKFLTALANAQVAEAVNILVNETTSVNSRESGLIEETVGESTQKFSSARSVGAVSGVSSQAIVMLRRYIASPSSIKIARA